MPGSLGDSWERRRAKHQALRATQMLHLCSCKRYAGREKVEAQAPGGAISRSWRSARGISAPSAPVREASGRPDQCATQGDASQPALCQLEAWGAGDCQAAPAKFRFQGSEGTLGQAHTAICSRSKRCNRQAGRVPMTSACNRIRGVSHGNGRHDNERA